MNIQKKIFCAIVMLSLFFGINQNVLAVTDEFGIPKERPQECVKILQDFKLKLTTTAGVAPADVEFEKGAIIASTKIDASGVATEVNAKCSHINGSASIQNSCSGTKIGGTDSCYVLVNGEFGGILLMNTLTNISNWIFYLVLIFSTIMIVYGGFVYITSAGDPAKAGQGKSIITFALIGLAIALLAKVLPSVMKFFLGL